MSIAKQSNILRTKIVPSSRIYTSPTPSTIYTPRGDTSAKSVATPLSAPVTAAGRSPTRTKPPKSQLRRRFAPPSLTTTPPTLSLVAALKGTLAHGKRSARPSLKRTSSRISDVQSKSWDFAIFEESEEQQDYRMCEWTMTQSSAALEISDDESKTKSFNRPESKDDRGKENIDPNEMLAISVPSALVSTVPDEHHETMDTKESRTPLSDLNASKFYGEGLNATSVVLVHDDEAGTELDSSNEAEQTVEAPEPEFNELPAPPTDAFTFEAPRQVTLEPEETIVIPHWAQITTAMSEESTVNDKNISLSNTDIEGATIDIWESESAKDENEQCQYADEDQRHCIIIGEGQTISLSSPCLDEL